MTSFALSSRVVKFRRTGESARSEDDTASGEHEVQIEGVRTGLQAVELDDGAAVPKEFANPTDGEGALPLGHQPRPQSGALRGLGCLPRGHAQRDLAKRQVGGPRGPRGDTESVSWTCMAYFKGLHHNPCHQRHPQHLAEDSTMMVVVMTVMVAMMVM